MPFRWQYQAIAEPVFVPAVPETITLDKWYQPPSLPLPPIKQAPVGFIVGPLVTSFGEVILLDKWFQPLQVPMLPLKQTRIGYFTEPLEPSLILEPPLESWHRPTNEPQWNAKRHPLGWVADVASWTPETVTVDKWFVQYPGPIVAPPRTLAGPGQVFFDQTAILDWLAEQSVPVRQVQLPIQAQFQLAFTPPIALDWLVDQAIPIRKVRQTSGMFVIPENQPVVITLEQWYPQQEVPVRAKVRAASFDAFFATFVVAAVVVEPPCPYRPEASDLADQFSQSEDISFAFTGNVDHSSLEAASEDEGDETYGKPDEEDYRPARQDECS